MIGANETHISLDEIYDYSLDLKDPLRFVPKDMYEPRCTTTNAQVNSAILSFRGIGRGRKHIRYLHGGKFPYIRCLAEQAASRISSKHNKNWIVVISGDLGSGKSMLSLELAYGTAQWLAFLKGGQPEDYFNMDHVSIIDPDTIHEKLSNLRQWEVYIFDDAGPGYDARNSQSNSNKDINYCLQVCRTSNNLLIISTPHLNMIDVTVRRLAHVLIELSSSHHDQGVSVAKVFNIIRDIRQNKVFYKFGTKLNLQIPRYISHLPPAEMIEIYEKRRLDEAQAITRRHAERQERTERKAPMGNVDKWSTAEFTDIMNEYVSSKHQVRSYGEIALELGVVENTVRRHMKRNNFGIKYDKKTKKRYVVKV
jgi:hypothetical protein